MLNSIVKRTTFSEEDKLKQNIEQETIINSEIKTSSHSNIDIELNNDSMDIPSQSKTSIDKPEFKTTYIHAIIGFILGLILLYISHFSNFEYHMVIRGTNISLGWFAIIYGIFKLFSPSKVLVKNEDDNSN